MLFFEAGTSELVSYISFDSKLFQVVMPDAFFADVKVVATAGESPTLTSNDPAIVSIDPSGSKQLYGMGPGFDTVVVALAPGIKAEINVKVRRRRDYGRTILKLGKALAVQDWNPVEPLNFAAKLSAKPMETETELMTRIAATGAHDHMFFSCHQLSDSLLLGSGVRNATAFAPLKGKVNTVWISGCAVLGGAHAAWGRAFCTDIAKHADCFVIACVTSVTAMLPHGPEEIEAFTEFSPVVFPPGGGPPLKGGETAFFRDRVKHNFKITKLGSIALK